MATIKQLISDGEAALEAGDSARLDAELLLGFAVEQTRTWLYTRPEHIPSLPEQHLYLELIRRRKHGEPVAYLTGRKAFWDLELKINQHVLIPRPESELLVEAVFEKLKGMEKATVADLGTGSGAIALAMGLTQPLWQITATDQSEDALELASENANKLEAHNVTLLAGDWTAPLAGLRFNAIVSNPPYIDEDDAHLKQGDVRFEPAHALISAENGLADIKIIINDSIEFLEPGGWLMLEHGYQQGEKVRQQFASKGYLEIETLKDLSGHERVTIGRKKDKG